MNTFNDSLNPYRENVASVSPVNEETKKCNRCGELLPLTSFNKCKSSKDGYYSICKSCRKIDYMNKGKVSKLSKVYSDVELAKFTPRQLLEELKARGYHGTLKCVTVKEAKI